jgi:hypothetical protein
MITSFWRSWLNRFSEASPRPQRSKKRCGHAPRPVRPRLEALEDRTLLSVTIAATNNSGNGYSGIDNYLAGDGSPPDSQGAAGPTSYVETVNQTIAIYTPKATGATKTSDGLSHFLQTVGGLSKADSGAWLSDPVVTYDDNMPGQTVSTGRFIVEDQSVDTGAAHKSVLDIAVSKSASPQTLSASDWNFYQVNTTSGTANADYPGNIGFNQDAVVTTLNMLGGAGGVQVISLSATDLVNGVSQSQLHIAQNNVIDNSLRPATEHDVAAGAAEWLITEGGGNNSLTVYKMTNVLSNSATFTTTQLTVNSYSTIQNPLNPDSSTITSDIDQRIQKVAEGNNTLVAAQAVGVSTSEDDVRWYVVDVSSGTPTLKDQGKVSAGNNTYLYFPSIDINPSGQIGMTYMRSGNDSTSDYMSMYITGRTSSDAAGTMETPVLVPNGTGLANYVDHQTGGPRAGDLSGISIDPSNGSFWAVNEFANNETSPNWGTAIANFTVGNPTYKQVDLSSAFNRTGIVTDGSTFPATGGLDANGHALSESLVGPSVTFGSVYFAIGAAGSNDDVSAAGQTINVTNGTYSTLWLVGTGVNGNQTSQTVTVNYTTGSPQTFTQSFSDWHTPQSYTGESQIASMSYRDLYGSGKQTLAFYLYGYTFSLDTTRQVQSIKLPSDSNVEVLAIDVDAVVKVSLSSSFNRTGIYNDGVSFSSTGGLDNNGHAFSGNLLGTSLAYNSNTYTIGAVGSNDVVSTAGQTITLPAGNYSSLSFLATAVNGNQTGLTFTVNYTTGSPTPLPQSFSDWHTPQNYSGESQAKHMTYRNNYHGMKVNLDFYLYAYSITLDKTRQVASITLPSNSNVELFAIDLIP